MRALLVACLLASCGPSSAIEVRIPIDPQLGVEHVRLYIGMDEPLVDSPQRLIGDGFEYDAVPPKTLYWRRDSETPDVAAVGSDHVSFVLQPGVTDHLGVVIAIGFKGETPVAAGSLFDLTMESGTVVRYEMTFAAAQQPPRMFKPPFPPVMIHTWGPAEDPNACAQLISTAPDIAARGSVAVVIKHDVDCDGLVTDETDVKETNGCLPDVFDGKIRPGQDALSCFTQELLPGTPVMASVMGGNGCVDGRTKTDGNCDPSAFCITPTLYAACKSSPLACASALDLTTQAQVLHIECSMPAELDGSGYTICEEPILLLSPNLGMFAVECTGEYRFVNRGRTGTDNAIKIEGTGTSGQVIADPPQAGCHLTLHPQGQVGLAFDGRVTALLEANLTSKRGIAIPIVLNVDKLLMGQTCTNTTALRECRLVGEPVAAAIPPVSQCAKSQIVDPW